MTGFLSFLFLLLVIWVLLHCIGVFLRLVSESLFSDSEQAKLKTSRALRPTALRPCPNPRCRKDNREEARFCAQCGQPLAARSGLAIDHAC